MFFPYARQKWNPLRGYWDTSRTSAWILQVYIWNFSFPQFSRKIKINPLLHSSNIYSFHMRERNRIQWGVTEIQAVQTHEYCKSIQEILHFSKISHFLNFHENSKLTIRCTAPIYVLSICEREMESMEGLRRYRPYKLMNIASPYKKFYIFQRFSHFLNFQEKSKLTPVAQLQYMFFPCAIGNLIRWGVTEIQAVQTHEYSKSI